MSAVVLDFFEWKYNHRVVVIKDMVNRYKDYLEIELLEVLKKDSERLMTDFTEDV